MKQFVIDAITGGWDMNGLKGQMNYGYEWKKNPFRIDEEYLECWDDIGGVFPLDLYQMAVDPKAWRAVGFTRGWRADYWEGEIKNYDGGGICRETERIDYEPYQFKRHKFLKLLDEGKRLEEALSEIK